jgi:hypothetical protein
MQARCLKWRALFRAAVEINHHFAYENRLISPNLALNLDLFLYISSPWIGPTLQHDAVNVKSCPLP